MRPALGRLYTLTCIATLSAGLLTALVLPRGSPWLPTAILSSLGALLLLVLGDAFGTRGVGDARERRNDGSSADPNFVPASVADSSSSSSGDGCAADGGGCDGGGGGD